MAQAYSTALEAKSNDNYYTRKIVLSTLTGVEGIPYQFLPSVDRRVLVTSGNKTEQSLIGRKYTEKIISRIPLLFLTPCEPLFMADKSFSSTDKSTVLSSLASGITGGDVDQLVKGTGKYYSVNFAYPRYYQYLNFMLASVASYLGLGSEKVKINGKEQELGTMDWSLEVQTSFKTYFSSKENLVFYLDGMQSISESFSNNTTQSSIASQVNSQFSEMAREVDFLLGSKVAGAMETVVGGAAEVGSTLASSLGSLVGLDTNNTILGSLTSQNGVSALLDGGKISFPDIWADSQFDKSYSIDIKLRSPDNDSLSIFLNVLKPYCKLLALVLPHSYKSNANAYRTPFLVRAYSKGLFNIDMGMITGLSVTKGASCCWNDDGLPTQIDISIDIADMYKNLYMSGYTDDDESVSTLSALNIFKASNNVKRAITNNTSYMDFLANMAGLNINQMELFRRTKEYFYLMKNDINTIDSTVNTRFDQAIGNVIKGMYEKW